MNEEIKDLEIGDIIEKDEADLDFHEDISVNDDLSNNIVSEAYSDNFGNNYFKEIKGIPLLTFEEEKELLEKKDKGDKIARRKLIEHNLRLVIKIAKKFQNRGLTLPDLIQKGNIGLIKAVDKFSLSKGTRLTTYAYLWIMQSITRALADEGRILRIPVHLLELHHKVSKFSNYFEQQFQRRPTIPEISESLKIKEHKIKNVLNLKSISLTLDQPIKNMDNRSINELLVSGENTFYQKLVLEEKIEIIKKLVEQLDERSKYIIKKRFDQNNNFTPTKYSLDDLGNELDISRERARQLEKNAIDFISKRFNACINDLFFLNN